MNPAIHQLVQSITGKSSLSECSISELEQLALQYPYFGPAQFILAQKLKEENSPQYTEQSQKALLYFSNHLWYDYLSADGESTGIIIPTKPAEAGKNAEDQVPGTVNEIAVPEENITPGEIVLQPVVSEDIHIAGETHETIAEQETAGEMTAVTQESAVPAEASLQPATSEDIHPATGESTSEESTRQEENLVQPIISGDIHTIKEVQETGLPGLRFEPGGSSEGTLTFEPYHTVDYFASQGIRSMENEKARDQFSQQLKSFTEWLKAMKRLPQAETTAARPAAGNDQKVEQMAERSIADREVITEAMADVWEKQGNHEKAIDTYRKLSLLNPAKSSYFAAKIEHLKHL
jgi:hypothetical protein